MAFLKGQDHDEDLVFDNPDFGSHLVLSPSLFHFRDFGHFSEYFPGLLE